MCIATYKNKMRPTIHITVTIIRSGIENVGLGHLNIQLTAPSKIAKASDVYERTTTVIDVTSAFGPA